MVAVVGARFPRRLSQSLEAELPDCCPHCGGELEETRIEKQYQTEIPEPQVERIEFHIHFGQCKGCRRRVQGRHPRQTSDAVGSAGSQLGARAWRWRPKLNKGLGLSYGRPHNCRTRLQVNRQRLWDSQSHGI